MNGTVGHTWLWNITYKFSKKVKKNTKRAELGVCGYLEIEEIGVTIVSRSIEPGSEPVTEKSESNPEWKRWKPRLGWQKIRGM